MEQINQEEEKEDDPLAHLKTRKPRKEKLREFSELEEWINTIQGDALIPDPPPNPDEDVDYQGDTLFYLVTQIEKLIATQSLPTFSQDLDNFLIELHSFTEHVFPLPKLKETLRRMHQELSKIQSSKTITAERIHKVLSASRNRLKLELQRY